MSASFVVIMFVLPVAIIALALVLSEKEKGSFDG